MEDEVTAFLRKRSATRDQLYTEETFQLFEQEREETKKRGEARIERVIQEAMEANRIRRVHTAKEEEHYRTIIARICESNPYDGLPESLPEELWLVIFEYLSYRGLIAMTCVCHTFKRIGHDELVVCCACLYCVSFRHAPSQLVLLPLCRIRYGGLNERGKKQGGSFGRDRGRRRTQQQRQHERGACGLCTLSFIC